MAEITSKSSYHDIVVFDGGAFKDFTKDQVDQFKKHFQTFDEDGDGSLNIFEVSQMFELLGDTKTSAEVRALMAEVDLNNDGTISFSEFLYCMKGGKTPSESGSNNILLKAYKNNSIKFFEEAAAATADKTDANKEKIKKEYEERKRLAAIKKAALEQEEAERKAEEDKKAASKANLAARAAMFEGK